MKANQRLLNAKIQLLFLFCSLLLVTCKKGGEESGDTQPVVNAEFTGKVHAPSGKAIGSAEIQAGIYKTLSDKNGDFVLPVAAGTYKLVIQTGGGHVFKTEISTHIEAKQTISLSYTQTELKQVKNLAYIPGNWDKIETIIIDTLGYSASALTLNDLSSLPTLTPYAALFLNCGLLEMSGMNMDSSKYANLNSYIAGLGSIYASDFAVECLTGDNHLRPGMDYRLSRMGHSAESGVHALASCVSPKIGGFIEDSSLCTLKSGLTGMIYNTDIISPAIINLLGKDSLDIYYDLGGWEVISQVDLPFNVIISDNNMGYGPLAASMDVDDENPGGVIFFTTFHNHPMGYYSHDIQDILEYFILNL